MFYKLHTLEILYVLCDILYLKHTISILNPNIISYTMYYILSITHTIYHIYYVSYVLHINQCFMYPINNKHILCIILYCIILYMSCYLR